MEQLVQFKNRTGNWLRGMAHLPATAGRRRRQAGVVFFHGFTADRMESHWIFVKCSRSLARAGIASLRFDFHGSGESDGVFSEVTLQGEISDARAAVNFLRQHRGIDPERVGLLGLSLGGAIAATIAASARARALVLWAALAHPSHLATLAESATQMIPESNGAREYGAHRISPRFLDRVDKVDPLRSIARFQQPTLIIHPEKDAYLPLSHPEDYFRACGAKAKEKVIIAGADHTFTSLAWEREVIDRTVEWFRTHL